MKKIAVVVLNWNGVKLLEQFLPTLIKYSNEATIYLADNCSRDNSIEFVKENYTSIKIISNKENFGFAKGYNEALKHVEEPYYCLLNSDVEVTENWLNQILYIFEKNSKVAIIQPKILDFKNKNSFEYAGAAGGFIDKFGYPYCRGRIFDSIEKDEGQYNDTIEIFWASGACFFIKKEVFQLLKGFDEDFFAHQEEIDLCWRNFNNGYITIYTSDSIVYHVGGATLNENNPKKTYLNFRNSLYMILKNAPNKSIFYLIIIRLFLDGLAGIQFLMKFKFKHVLAIIKAHFSFYGNIHKTLKKRNGKHSNNYYRSRSIVYNYFIKKQTVFNK